MASWSVAAAVAKFAGADLGRLKYVVSTRLPLSNYPGLYEQAPTEELVKVLPSEPRVSVFDAKPFDA